MSSGDLRFNYESLNFSIFTPFDIPQEFFTGKIYVMAESGSKTIYLSTTGSSLWTLYGTAVITGGPLYNINIPSLCVGITGLKSGQELDVYLTNNGMIAFSPYTANGDMLPTCNNRRAKNKPAIRRYAKIDATECNITEAALSLYYVSIKLELAEQKKKNDATLHAATMEKLKRQLARLDEEKLLYCK